MSILVTGGAGYIGSHTCVELLNAGYDVIVVDNLCNSKEESLKRVKEITGKELKFYKADISDKESLDKIFSENKIDAVLHFAGLKAVGESVAMPLKYYYNNIIGTLTLCDVCNEHGVNKMVFSSSATVYGDPDRVPITEDFKLDPKNPYGRTKLMIEEILNDVYGSNKKWSIAILRYFNPIGAHESGKIGEDPNGIPNNLLPYISQVSVGKLKELKIFGNDYSTHDGTGVRDYIHVVDLASGHLKALDKVMNSNGVKVYNLGTGKGYSVLEVLSAFEKASGRKIPYKFAPRRPGDIAVCYADPTKAQKELGWTATRNINKMCKDAWNWQRSNLRGYEQEVVNLPQKNHRRKFDFRNKLIQIKDKILNNTLSKDTKLKNM